MADGLVAEAKALIEEAEAEEEQLDLLEPVTPEEMAEAQEELGASAGNLTVLKHARAKKTGRPKGVRNKRTDDFARYISQFGTDPAITLMEIQSTAPEVLVERSKMLDPTKRRMSYGDAQQLRVRCAEALMSFIHSKKPVAIDANIRGIFVNEIIGEVRGAPGSTIDGEILGVAAPMEDDE